MQRPQNSPRGTYDLLPEDAHIWHKIEDKAKEILQNAGFGEIRTPIFEATEIFVRATGETSDIVNKEMYTFLDRSERSLTLRPEGTACVVRAYLSNGLDRKPKPVKLWYEGNMFRYERSQKGRYRQFTQLGVEIFGSADIKIEFEAIYLAIKLFNELGLKDLRLEINSLGDSESRKAYQEVLKEFLSANKEALCPDCQRRIDTNPLRALDCKVKADQELYEKSAPRMSDYLTQASKDRQGRLCELLDAFNVKYIINNSLVRGLDYYTETVFEIKTESDELAGQNTICAGGRYDNLVSEFGGENTPAFGWAIGLERLVHLIKANTLQACSERSLKRKMFVISSSEDFISAYKLAEKLREMSFEVLLEYDNKAPNKQFTSAIKQDYSHIIELSKEKISVKCLQNLDEEGKPSSHTFESPDKLLVFLSKD